MIRRVALSYLLLHALAAHGDTSAVSDTTVIQGATLHTLGAQGIIENSTIIVRDNVIASVTGSGNAEIPEGARRIDAHGMVITPGLFAAISRVGLVEVNGVVASADFVQRGDHFSASFDIADAYNPRSTLVAVNRAEGVTTALTAPYAARPDSAGKSSVFSGQGAVVHLGSPEDAIDTRGAVVVAQLSKLPSSPVGSPVIHSRAETLQTIRAGLDDALHYHRNRSRYDRGNTRPYTLSQADMLVLKRVLDGDVPLLVAANRASDISALIRLAKDYDLRLIVLGGAEAWLVAAELAEIGASVILDATGNLPRNFDLINARLDSAKMLDEAGVTISFGAGLRIHNLGNLTQAAGIAVAHGLSYESALAALTRNPARMYGLEDDLGSIEPGKVANLVIWPGDPLELTHFPSAVMVQGRMVPMQNRQTMLRDRYLKSSNLPPAFR